MYKRRRSITFSLAARAVYRVVVVPRLARGDDARMTKSREARAKSLAAAAKRGRGRASPRVARSVGYRDERGGSRIQARARHGDPDASRLHTLERTRRPNTQSCCCCCCSFSRPRSPSPRERVSDTKLTSARTSVIDANTIYARRTLERANERLTLTQFNDDGVGDILSLVVFSATTTRGEEGEEEEKVVEEEEVAACVRASVRAPVRPSSPRTDSEADSGNDVNLQQ